MINLLPPELKDTYRYARRNRSLSHWITAGALCLAGGVALAGGGYLYLNRSIASTTQQISLTTDQLKRQDQAGIQRQVTAISNNLKLATQVLSKEVLFSDLLKQLATVTPNNVILTNLAITQTQGGVDITAQTANYNAATQLQVNLADPKNQIFSKADIQNITCTGASSNPQYPCTVSIRALFAANNPFLFINNKKGAS